MNAKLRQEHILAIWLSRLISSKPALDLLALAVLAIGAYGALHGIDAVMYVNSDTLYPVQIQYYGWFDYRPPPSNNVFPDVLMHSLVHTWVTDPLQQKLVVGVLVFFISAMVIGWTLNYPAMLAFVAIYSVSGFHFFDSTAHFSLPLCMALVLWARSPGLRLAVLFVGVFSDLLLLLPLLVFWQGPPVVRRDGGAPAFQSRSYAKKIPVLVAGLAVTLNILYSEFSASAAQLLPLAAGFGVAAYAAKRLGWHQAFAWAVILVLLGMALLDIAPDRYALPVAASILLVLLATSTAQPELNWRPAWRIVALPIAYIGLLAFGLTTVNHERLSTQYDCLAAALKARNIQVVAADHWTAKPLYFALLNPSNDSPVSGSSVSITQLNFSDGRYHLWMAPHAFYGIPTRWAIHNRYACKTFTSEPRYCGQADTAPVVGLTPVCDVFDLIEYRNPLPSVGRPVPPNKAAAIYRHGRYYLDKARRVLQP